MELKTSFGLVLLITFLFVHDVRAKEWRGIVPLHSTRADVVRKFSQCANGVDTCVVRIGNEDAYIVFSTGAMSEYHECARRLPTDTVMHIEVELEVSRKMSAMGIRQRRFHRFFPAAAPDKRYGGYVDEDDGWVVETYKGRVKRLYYIAGRKDWALCPSYYHASEAFIRYTVDWCCPPISMGCPSAVLEGDHAIFTANTLALRRATYKWQVSAGRITAGQGTRRITVDTAGAAGRQLKATVELHGGRNLESTSSSCEVLISNRPRN